VQEKLAIDGLVINPEHDGWLDVTVRGEGGAAKVVRLDGMRCYMQYVAIAGEHEDEGERAAAWAAFLRDQGCGELSQATALRVAVKCSEMVPPDYFQRVRERRALMQRLQPGYGRF
jgi:hypothetical protein